MNNNNDRHNIHYHNLTQLIAHKLSSIGVTLKYIIITYLNHAQ